jgi:SAM-dependent methyltransferase
VEPEVDGRFDLVLAVDTIRRLNADDIVLTHLGWLLAPGGHLLAVDPVDRVDWAPVRSGYQAILPGVRIEQVQPEVMGLRWTAPKSITM